MQPYEPVGSALYSDRSIPRRKVCVRVYAENNEWTAKGPEVGR